jgi:hypothetical protein
MNDVLCKGNEEQKVKYNFDFRKFLNYAFYAL